MCGIAGIITRAASTTPACELARNMAHALAHRGPDDRGLWTDESRHVALAHRRLAIFGLSAAGNQPMASSCGRYICVFNGAIYNHRELRRQLEADGLTFRTTTDTEVLVGAVQRWGFVDTLHRIVGMFAIAVWDRAEARLYLARDRAGQKPLYYGRVGQDFAFASELKAFLCLPGFKPTIDSTAARLYAEYGYVPAPHCIYRGLRKLLPGHYATLQMDSTGDVMLQSYWRRSDFRPTEAAAPYEEVRRNVELLLGDAVAQRMAADVPVGAFLSGGFDSTATVALMQEFSTAPVRTFTIGSTDPAFDETQPASAIVTHLGSEHTAIPLGLDMVLNLVPDLAQIYDEPFADSSQIPTVLLARASRPYITVALTGDGGDEVFGGYNRHRFAPKVWKALRLLPLPVRRGISALSQGLSPESWEALGQLVGARGIPQIANKMQKLARLLPARCPRDLYGQLLRCWTSEPLAANPMPRETPWYDAADPVPDVADMMMRFDFAGYLPDDVLVKVDRGTMSVGQEARAPFLDPSVVAYVAGLPTAYKIDGDVTKRILRDIVAARVPAALIDRPKTGFDVPLATWLRGPLRDWAESLLDDRGLEESQVFDAGAVKRAWRQHQSGTANRQEELWCVLMFQQWVQRYRPSV